MSDPFETLLKLLILIAIAVGVTGIITQCQVDESWRQQIVSHGFGHYYLDSNGHSKWDWNK